MKIKILIKLLILSIVVCTFSCLSTEENVMSLSDEAKHKIDAVDLLFLKFKTTGDNKNLSDTESVISDLSKMSRKNKNFEAKVLALSTQLDILKNNTLNIQKNIKLIESKNANEERLFIIKAELEKDLLKKETIIKTGLENAYTTDQLKLYLSDMYFLKGNFSDAATFYDDALINLPQDFKPFYIKRRDLSYKLINTVLQNTNTIKLLLKDELNYEDFANLSINEISVLKILLNYNNQKTNDLLKLMFDEKYFYIADCLTGKNAIQRKDLSFFILNLIAKSEKNQNILNKYNKLTNVGSDKDIFIKSPVPDINVDDYFYTAALILVEREILELPDGINFYPEKTFAGTDYLDIIKKINKYYK